MDEKEQTSLGVGSPRVIVGMSRAQWERQQFLDAKRPTFPPGVLPVVVDNYMVPNDPHLMGLIDQQVLVPDVLLVRSPFNTGRYVPENRAYLEFQREKMELVARLCRLLGATKVESQLETFELNSTERNKRFSLQKKAGNKILFRGDGGVTLKERNTAREELAMSRSFPPHEVNIGEALQFLETHNLRDPEIQGLVEARQGASPANHLRVRVAFEAAQDGSLKVAGTVKLPGWFADGAYESKRTYQQKISMVLDISFIDQGHE